MSDSGLVHRPPISDRLQESRLRNLLMDIGLVTYLATEDLYRLEEPGVELYVWAKNLKSRSTRERFDKDSQKKIDLGFGAEVAAFEYEKGRVGEEWANNVEHVSAKNPFACYDIKSVTAQEDQIVSRYIEVKAEAADSHQFFWTASEVEAARLLRKKYFLYLLPVNQGGGCDLRRMLIIQDPFISVYKNPEEWFIQENVIVCRQKQKP